MAPDQKPTVSTYSALPESKAHELFIGGGMVSFGGG